jgi:NAD+ kinase
MTRARRVALLGHLARPEVGRAAARLRARLARRGHEVGVERALADTLRIPGQPLETLAERCDVLVTLGGDGTVLQGGVAMAGRRGVLLGVNFGGMGFLAAAEQDELDEAVDATLAGRWPVRARRLARASVRRAERRAGARARRALGPADIAGRPAAGGLAMNDAVVKAAGGLAAVHLQMRALGQDLGHLVADGIIVSTAAGSTAYSLSAGGPVLAPGVEALLVTPVCAHSLGSRALVLPPDQEVSLTVLGGLDAPHLLLDGRAAGTLGRGDEVRVRLDRAAVRAVLHPERPFARSLQSKLGWQGSARRSL